MKIGIMALMLASFAGCSVQTKAPAPESDVAIWEDRTPVGQPLAGSEGVLLKVAARVKTVDLASRRMTLLGADGETFTIKVSDQVQRLNEIKAGDDIAVEYLEAIAFEVRPPTAQERKEPAEVVLEAGRGDSGLPPAAGAMGMLRKIVTISKIDKRTGTVTFKLPEGGTVTIKAKYPENLNRVKVGDTVAVSYTEALAVGVVPAGTRP